MVGAQAPRLRIVPEGVDHPRWNEIVQFLNRAEIALDPWQLEILRVSLMVRADGLWSAFVVAVCCPRQNGKNEILEARELVGACVLEEPLTIHSAHLADTSREAFRRMEEKIDRSDFLRSQLRHVWRSNGHETIEFANGARIRFRTRTRSSGRGFAAGLVVGDEAMYFSEESESSIMYVLSAQENPQLWFTGSAVDQTTMEDGIVFTRYRENAINGRAERLAWFEWSLDYERPELVPGEFDEAAVAATNPAYGIRITEQYVRAEWEAIGSARGYAVERTGVGDWPDIDATSTVIPIDAWRDLVDEHSEIRDPICLAYDVSPDRKCAIGAGGRNDDGFLHVEVVDERQGTGWLAPRLVELAKAHGPVAIVTDNRGPGASLIPQVRDALADAGFDLQEVTATENAQACSLLIDAVEEQTLRHLGDPRVENAIRGAATRPLGDSISWARRSSSVNISPLFVITLALWATMGCPDPTRELAIY